uniref:UPAR/Ly6 domain-containing protein n=1 Tax=Xenopus tropicalis TaxID=8364 RepID=A0A6I8QZ65_XENTR
MWEYSAIFAAVPLKCYRCVGATSNADCQTQTDCGPNDAYCMTVVASVSGKTAIGKSCTPSCTPGSASTGGVTGTISCCKTDLCNGATGVKYSYPALGLSLGFLLVLLRGSAL